MHNDLPLVSIIVPVYNNEKHIGQALESLVNQSLPSEKCEIIAIDDGSTDSSGAICDSYAKAHANVIVVHQENGGVSRARNNGLALFLHSRNDFGQVLHIYFFTATEGDTIFGSLYLIADRVYTE